MRFEKVERHADAYVAVFIDDGAQVDVEVSQTAYLAALSGATPRPPSLGARFTGVLYRQARVDGGRVPRAGDVYRSATKDGGWLMVTADGDLIPFTDSDIKSGTLDTPESVTISRTIAGRDVVLCAAGEMTTRDSRGR